MHHILLEIRIVGVNVCEGQAVEEKNHPDSWLSQLILVGLLSWSSQMSLDWDSAKPIQVTLSVPTQKRKK